MDDVMPMVECSFNMMNDINDSKSGCTEVETHSTITTTKYNWKCGKSAVLKTRWKDILWDPVDSTFSYYTRTSSSHYKKYLKSKQDKMLLQKNVFKSNKEEKKRNFTQAGYSFIYGCILDSNKIYSFALETFSENVFLYERKSWSVVYSLQEKT